MSNLLLSCSLANVDPVDVARSIKDLDPEATLGNQHASPFSASLSA
jgi:hypothetical protein